MKQYYADTRKFTVRLLSFLTAIHPFFFVFHCHLGLGELHSCPFPKVSSHLFHCLLCFLLPFTMPCELVLVVPDEWETCPYHLSLRWSGGLYHGQEVFVWSDCLLDLGTDCLVGMRYILSWLPFGCVRLYHLCEYFEKMFDHSLLACSF